MNKPRILNHSLFNGVHLAGCDGFSISQNYIGVAPVAGRVSGTALANPDFAALARAYGAQGEAVTTTGGFAPAFERALAHDGPTLLHVKLDPQALTMNASLDALREAGLRARA